VSTTNILAAAVTYIKEHCAGKTEQKIQHELQTIVELSDEVVQEAFAMVKTAQSASEKKFAPINGHSTKEEIAQARVAVADVPVAVEGPQSSTVIDPLPELPAFLKGINNWVRWKLEPSADGKPTKVPYRLDGRKAASTRPEDWTDYHRAVAGAVLDDKQGVGFVVNGGIVGFDLDGCRNPQTGELAPWAEQIIDALESYTEITPSQTGARVWVRGELPGKDKVFNLDPAVGFGDKVKIEVFTEARYFTVTGDSYFEPSGDVEERDMTAVYQMLHDIRANHPAPTPRKDSVDTDAGEPTKIELLGTFGTTKYDIFMHGEIESREPFVISNRIGRLTYPSQSEADMGFATVLAIQYNGDVQKIDGEFRKSALYRPKWERADYRNKTITKAVESGETVKANSVPMLTVEIAAMAEDRAPAYTISLEEVEAEIKKDFPVIPLPAQGGPTWDDSILYGLVGEIVKRAVEYSESHPAGIYLDLLVSLGNVFGRSAYFNVNHTKHYTNEFMVRVGPTSKGRKGGGRDTVDEIMRLVDSDWLKDRTMSGFGSGEAVIDQLRDASQQTVRNRQKGTDGFKTITVPGVADKRLCVRAGEIAGTFEVASRQGSLMSVILRDGWDSKPLMNTVKGKTDGLSNSASCREPHLSVSGDSTKEELIAKMPDNSAENGFGNRFLYVYVYRTKLCPLGGPEIVWDKEITRLYEVVQFAKTQRYVGLSKSAEKVWARMYAEIDNQTIPGLAGKMVARAAAHIRRLALILAVIDKSPVVESKHLQAAKKLWDYCEQSAQYIFTGVTREQAKIVRHVEKSGATTATQVCRDLFQRNRPMAWVQSQIDDLIATGQLQCQNHVITKK